MKKLLMIAILMLALVVTVVACTNTSETTTTAGETTAAPAPAQTTAEPVADTTAEPTPGETTAEPVPGETTEEPAVTTTEPPVVTTAEPDTTEPEPPVGGLVLFNGVYHANVDWFNACEVYYGSGSSTLNGDGSLPVVDATEKNIKITDDYTIGLWGWMAVEGGINHYAYTVNGGELVTAIGGTDGEPQANFYAGLGFTGAEKNGWFSGDDLVLADLSAYVGQTVTVTFYAVPEAAQNTVAPMVTIEGLVVSDASDEPDGPSQEPVDGLLSREGMTATASSEWIANDEHPFSYPAQNVLDGNIDTFWNSDWNNVPADCITLEIDLNGEKTFNKFAYYPRQLENLQSIILEYEIYAVDQDGNYGSEPIATGEWAQDLTEKFATFDEVTTTKIKLVVKKTSGNFTGANVVCAAEINFYYVPETTDPEPEVPTEPVTGKLSTEGMTATASSEWIANDEHPFSYPAQNLLDGNIDTFWNSDWNNIPADSIVLEFDLNGEKTLNQIGYIPRQLANLQSIILEYEIYAADQDGNYGSEPIATGEWAQDLTEKFASFDEVTTTKIKLVVKKTSGNVSGANVVCGAEVSFYYVAGTTEPEPEVPVEPEIPAEPVKEKLSTEGMTATASSEWIANDEHPYSYPAQNLLDGNIDTFWNSDWNNIPADSIVLEFDLNGEKKICQISYIPRQQANLQSIILEYEIYAADQDGNYGSEPIATGEWAQDLTEKFATFDEVTTTKIKLVVKKTSGNMSGANVVCGAEVAFYGKA